MTNYQDIYNRIWSLKVANSGTVGEAVIQYSTLIDRLHPRAYPQRSALDVGTGMGTNAIYLAKRGHTVEALDFSHESVRKVTEFATQQKLPITCSVADITNYSPAKKFDTVVSIDTLHFLDRELVEPTIKKLSDATADNGYAVVRTFTQNNMQKYCGLIEKGLLSDMFRDWNILTYNEEQTPWEIHEGSDWHCHNFAQIIAQKR